MYDITRHFDVLYTSSEEVRVCCPFCGEQKFHMYINLSKGVAHCFRCTWGGRVWHVIAKKTGVNYKKIRYKMASEDPVMPSLSAYDAAVSRLKDVGDINSKEDVMLPAGYVPFTHDKPADKIGCYALDYLLRKRRFKRDTIIRYGLGYGTARPILGRVVIPVDGKYWQARAITANAQQKYLNPIGSKGDVLFNATALRLDTVFICEGAFSAMRLGRNATALLGKKPTPQQLERLKRSDVSRFTIAFDSDAIGQSYGLAEILLKAGKRVTVREYAWGDPDEGEVSRETHFEDILAFSLSKLQNHSV